MKFLKKINIKITIVVVVFFVGVFSLLFNEFGIMKFLRLTKEVNSINNDIKSVKDENRALKNEVDSLDRKVPAKIEKAAREKYGMSRKGERTIEIIEK